jgi:phosphoglycolate phosphatase
MIKAVIFDLDDTLVDTKKAKFKAIQFAGKKFYNIDINDELLNSHYGKPIREFFDIVFKHVENVDLILKNFMTIRDQYPSLPFPDTIEVVDQLLKKYVISVVSSAARQMVLNDLKVAQLPVDQFKMILSADDTKFHKPDPRVFDPMIGYFSKFNIIPKEIAYVGDTINDYKAAFGAGLYFCGIAGRTTTKSEFAENKSDFITDIRQLPDKIKNVL